MRSTAHAVFILGRDSCHDFTALARTVWAPERMCTKLAGLKVLLFKRPNWAR